MTGEEVERTLQRVAVAIEQLTQMAVRADERQDSADLAQQNADQRFNALIDAQVGHENRQARLEESYLLLVQLARIQEERIDSQDESLIQTDARLDALIDSQIALGQHVEQLTARIDSLAVAQGRTDDQIKELTSAQSENAAHIKALVEAQARTDEQIRHVLERNGSPKAKAKKPSAKKTKKGVRAK